MRWLQRAWRFGERIGTQHVLSLATVAAAALSTGTGCSALVDKDAVQCTIDADCERLGGHPQCNAGICVETGLGPEGCFAGTPTKQSEFLNACSVSRYEAYDNCERLGLCNGQALPTPTDRGGQLKSTPATAPTRPTNACNEPSSATTDPVNMIYLYGSSDFGPLLRAVQPSLYALPQKYRAVFLGTSSCNGAAAAFDPLKRTMKDPPIGNPNNQAYAFYFNEKREQVNCVFDTTTANAAVPVDIGISNLYASQCNAAYVPGGAVAEYLGPVVPFVLSVPDASKQTAISAEALHFVFGLQGHAPAGSGMKDAVPWTDQTQFSVRSSTAGSTVLTSLLIDVPADKFWGVDRQSTENLRDALLTATNADASVGILSIDFNDKNRGNLKALYLQARDQKVGYLPDRTPTTFDKANVRDGHYPLWGYVHFFTALSGSEPSAAAKAFVLQFNVPKLEQQLLDDIIAASLVPQCAMTVERKQEMKDFSSRTGLSCGCYFESKTGSTSCKQCTTATDCPNSAPCNYGYCEVEQK